MAWLSRVNFISSDTLSFSDINNLGNDIRAWGDNVNGGGYTLSNVALSASSGTMATVTGGTGAASTLTIRSTSGTGTSDAIVFQTASQSERMRINASGNIGIGTGSTIRSILNTNVGTITGPAVTAGLTLSAIYSGVTAVNSIDWNYSGQTSSPVRLGATFNSDGNGMEMVFYTSTSFSSNGSERVRINKDGNVGIGTSSPATESTNAKLAVVGSSNQSASTLATSNSNAGFTVRANASSGYQLAVGATSVDGAPYIQGVNYNGGAAPSNLTLQGYGGNVGIGTASPAYQLQLSTDSAAKPTTNTWTIASDARLKTVRGEYEKGLAEICALRPVRYEYNGKGGFTADGKEQISILAQEAQEVFPECVNTFRGKLEEDGEEMDLLNYNGHAITFAMINAIKELKAKIDILEARN